MHILSLVWGILAVCGMLVALIPCLGALNWLNIPFAVIGLIISIVSLATDKAGKSGSSIAGIACCSVAVVVGTIRLFLGGGVF